MGVGPKKKRKKTAERGSLKLDAGAAVPLGAASGAAVAVHSRGGATRVVLRAARQMRGHLRGLAINSLRGWFAAMPKPMHSFIAGGLAGALSKTAAAPLETVRIRCMTSRATAARAVADIWAAGGPLAFFAGNSADLLRVMPSKAIELAAFDAYKAMLLSAAARCSRLGALPLLLPRARGHTRNDSNGNSGNSGGGGGGDDGVSPRMAAAVTAVAGAAAGMTAQLLLFPLETVRTRMAAAPALYPTIPATLAAVARADGAPALYRGLDASLVGVVPYAALKLGIFDGAKAAWRQHTGQERVPPGVSAGAGALAAVLAASATYPLEVARRRMMMGAGYANTAAAVSGIAAAEGVRALYAGIGLSILKQAPQYAVAFMAYDAMKAAMAAAASSPAVLSSPQPAVSAAIAPSAGSMPTPPPELAADTAALEPHASNTRRRAARAPAALPAIAASGAVTGR